MARPRALEARVIEIVMVEGGVEAAVAVAASAAALNLGLLIVVVTAVQMCLLSFCWC